MWGRGAQGEWLGGSVAEVGGRTGLIVGRRDPRQPGLSQQPMKAERF